MSGDAAVPGDAGTPSASEGAEAGQGAGGRVVVSAGLLQVLAGDGTVAGAGFLTDEATAVTCAHVVRVAGAGPGGQVELAFPHLAGAPRTYGRVPTRFWRAPDEQDVAFLHVEQVPAQARSLSLGAAAPCRGHRVHAFGFPEHAPHSGHFGYGRAGDLLPDGPGGQLLQLHEANDVTTGFSGGPVLDEATGLVIGMVTAITTPDTHLKGLGIAYATPTEVLRKIRPGLAVQQLHPYRGLEPFTAEHSRFFFGRDDAIHLVLSELGRQRRLILLLGPSGAGKSSLLQAGVLPALAGGAVPGSDRWLPVYTRPGQDLTGELERAGLPGATHGLQSAVQRRLADDPDHDRVLLVIDQFEEFLAQPAIAATGQSRNPAQDLVAAVRAHAACTVLLIMRDDFYPRLAATAPQILEITAPALLNIPATLDPPDLQAIITRPAQEVGARFEDGLTERIITDILATAPDGQAPVTLLPPLELALAQLWQHLDDNGRLTHHAYQQIGAVTGSLTTWCNAAMTELAADRRPAAQRLLTALIRPADEARAIPATRQQVPLARLRALSTDPDIPDSLQDTVFDEVLATLTRHRVITTRTPPCVDDGSGEPTAELIHEALLRDWGDLHDWAAQDRRFHLWLHRTTEQAARHTRSEQSGDLVAGSALQEGLDWARQRALPADITAFLAASQKKQQTAARRARRINIVLAGLLVMALIAAGTAFWQQQAARTAQKSAVTAQRQAQSRQLAAQSTALIETDPDLASLLAIQAYRRSATDEASASLYAAAALPLRHRLTEHNGGVFSIVYSPDGHTLATGGADREVRLRDATTGKTRAVLGGHLEGAGIIRFSPDGRMLVTSREKDGKVRLWNAENGARIATIVKRLDSVNSLDFSPDGRSVAISGNAEMRIWQVSTHAMHVIPTGYSFGVQDAEFSPDGRSLATSGISDDRVLLWDVATGKRKAVLTGHGTAEGAVPIAFSPDGRTLATSGSENGKVHLWNTDTYRNRVTFASHVFDLDTLLFSPNGRVIATSSINDDVVRLWDSVTGKRRVSMTGHTDGVWSLAFSPNSALLVSGSGDKAVQLWDAATGKDRAKFTGHAAGVWAVAFSPDGDDLATGSADSTVRIWDVTTVEGRAVLIGPPIESPVAFAVFSPDGRALATGTGGATVRLWDVDTGKRLATLNGHARGVYTAAFSPDGRTLATGSADNTARLWNVRTGKGISTLVGHTGHVRMVKFSPDGRTLATGSADNSVRLWDIPPNGRSRVTLKGHAGRVELMEFSPDGRTLVTSGVGDDRIFVWDAISGVKRAASLAHEGSGVWEILFSPDGSTLATASVNENVVGIWDPYTGRRRYSLKGRVRYVSAVEFSPDSRTLAVGGGGSGESGPAQLWDVATGRSRAVLTGHNEELYTVKFSPDGHTLATGSVDNTARLWDVSSGESRATLTGHTEDVDVIEFSPDGHILATGSTDDTVRLWDVATGSERATLIGDPRFESVVAFSPDGLTLATGGTESEIVRLWDVASSSQAEMIESLCRAVGRDFRSGEKATYFPDYPPTSACRISKANAVASR